MAWAAAGVVWLGVEAEGATQRLEGVAMGAVVVVATTWRRPGWDFLADELRMTTQ